MWFDSDDEASSQHPGTTLQMGSENWLNLRVFKYKRDPAECERAYSLVYNNKPRIVNVNELADFQLCGPDQSEAFSNLIRQSRGSTKGEKIYVKHVFAMEIYHLFRLEQHTRTYSKMKEG